MYKSGDHSQCSNCRPIALSLSTSKIFEKCIKTKILQFLNNKNFFSKNQFGFLTGTSTRDSLFTVNKFLHENLDSNNKVLSIYLDIKKVFDSVNHNILLEKLAHAGLRGTFSVKHMTLISIV